MATMLDFTNTKPLTQVSHDFRVCYVIDDMAILNRLNPKINMSKPRCRSRSPSDACHIFDKSNIDKVATYELLSSEGTKQSISHYLSKTVKLELRKR